MTDNMKIPECISIHGKFINQSAVNILFDTQKVVGKKVVSISIQYEETELWFMPKFEIREAVIEEAFENKENYRIGFKIKPGDWIVLTDQRKCARFLRWLYYRSRIARFVLNMLYNQKSK